MFISGPDGPEMTKLVEVGRYLVDQNYKCNDSCVDVFDRLGVVLDRDAASLVGSATARFTFFPASMLSSDTSRTLTKRFCAPRCNKCVLLWQRYLNTLQTCRVGKAYVICRCSLFCGVLFRRGCRRRCCWRTPNKTGSCCCPLPLCRGGRSPRYTCTAAQGMRHFSEVASKGYRKNVRLFCEKLTGRGQERRDRARTFPPKL